MLTPAMPLSIFMFVGLTVGLGMCVGWAWGCASMASGLRARSSSRFEAQLAAERAR
jgi:hypothetical protein